MTDSPAATERSLTLTRRLPARPEAVFRAWTQPDAIRRWWAPEGMTVEAVEVDLRVGGRYRLGLKPAAGEPFWATGEYLEIDAPRRLAFTWRWEPAEMMDVGATKVTIEIRERGDGSEIVLVHDGFTDATLREKHEEGWGSCLDRIEADLG